MKSRMGFVSNSSSSSFVLSTHKDKLEDIEFSITAKMSQIYGTRLLATMDEVMGYIKDEYSWQLKEGMTIEKYVEENDDDHDDLVLFYTACINALTKGEKIIVGSVSNESGEDFENVILNYGFKSVDTEDFKIIHDAEY